MNSSPVNSTSRLPSAGFSGLFCSVTDSLCPAGQLVMTSLIGRSTAMRRRATRFSSLRTNHSSISIWWRLLVLATPMNSQKLRIAAAG
jgi:hypothetical protein